MKVGIVGAGADKFTEASKLMAVGIIRGLLKEGDVVVSGHSPVGGVDIWAEEVAAEKGLKTEIYAPQVDRWDGGNRIGYKQRNRQIAENSDEVNVIVVDTYPPGFAAHRFPVCYHCIKRGQENTHSKSGGCWTALRAQELGKPATWHVVRNGV